MPCPECGGPTFACVGLDDDDYSVFGDCCMDEGCGWTNLWDEE